MYINRAMGSEKNKDLFLKQVEQILDGIRKDKEKVAYDIYYSCVLCLVCLTA